MATVPGVLYLAGYHGQGGAAPFFPGYPQSQLAAINDPRLERFVPSNDPIGETEQPIPDFHPWYDGTASNLTYRVGSSGASTVTATPSPGWTVNAYAGRKITILEHLYGYSGFPLMPREVRVIASNTIDTITVSAPWGSSPSTPAAEVAFRIGTGRFIGYNSQPGTYGFLGVNDLFATTGIPVAVTQGMGSAFDAAGSGLGPDAGMVPALFRKLWGIAPWFKVYKHARTVGVHAGYANGGGARAEFVAELARVTAAATERGDVIAWKLCVIDICEFDIRTASFESTYVQEVGQMIEWLRTTLANPALHFQIVQHDPVAHSLNHPGATRRWRGMHRQIARTTPRVALVDMAGEVMSKWTHAPEGPDYAYYARPRYQPQGEKFVDTYLRQLAVGVAPAVGTGLPIYFLLGDDLAVGNIPEDWIIRTAATSLIGDYPTFVRRPGARVWSELSGSMEPYDATTNANTSGTVVDAAGPEVSLIDELDRLHPETGFLLVKRSSVMSALATQVQAYTGAGASGGRWIDAAAEHLDALVTQIRKAEQLAASLGYLPDVRGGFVSLSRWDATVAGGGAAFALALPDFVADLRTYLTSRTSGKSLPLTWRRPALAAAGLRPAERDAIRAALASQAAQDSQFRVVDTDDLERDRADNWRDTPDSAVEAGRRMAAAMAGVAL